ncbi:urease accessory protein UreD [Streptacidiphilus sp. P02-A3a]|uniref:urease accessory protein UreD n=1 Tax=Streptacidiphilus sp. P02-A3a TaxID=2704468 RepID=UPI0015FA47B1|nr:urease accessory protein UreD [Streptacidiphilus sp. P02-A3a]QMU69560.1 urease accessory protein UreD [Streptacidiphilus sp. P02-A3a]
MSPPQEAGPAPVRLLPRLSAAHYTPDRIPPEVLRYAAEPATLAAGSPGKVGLLELGFEVRGGRTELVRRYQKSPLQIMRPLYVDPLRPQTAFTYLMSVGGGIVQADRYRIDVGCGPGTEVHLTTQAATKVYGMERGFATQLVNLDAGPGAYLEYLPDPLIPFRHARLYQRTVVTADPDATVVLGETVAAGRIARGELHAYDALALDLELRRPDGRLLAVDNQRLCPGAGPGGPLGSRGSGGVLGPAVLSGHRYASSLYVLTGRRPAPEIADALHDALSGTGLLHGASVLPQDCGAWLRVLADDSPRLTAALHAAWDAVRRLLTGSPAPDLRKS